MTHLEQFNKKVRKEFDKKFPVEIHGLKLEWKWIPTRLELEDFITQKLTEHKALILKMVREKVPSIKQGSQNEGDSYAEIGWNDCRKEFLNNLDTI